jgi:tetratricopeptide (TPR) repeat protein
MKPYLSFLFTTGFLLLASLPMPSVAQVLENSALREQALSVMQLVYDMRFDEAQAEIARLKRHHPEKPMAYFLHGINRYWQTNVARSMRVFGDEVEEQMGLALEKVEQYEDREDYAQTYHFLRFMAYAIQSRMHVLAQEDWSAANDARKVLDPLKAGFAYTDRSLELNFSTGLYHYYAKAYPRDHAYVRPFMVFFPEGDIEKGLGEMEQAASAPNLAQEEALYYLSEIYLFEDDRLDASLSAARRVYDRHPDNTWFRADLIRSLIAKGAYDEARSHIEAMVKAFEAQPGALSRNIDSRESRFTSNVMMRVYHYQGRLELEGPQQTLSAAIAALRRSLKVAQLGEITRDEYLPASWYYLGRCYDRQGKRKQATNAYETVLDLPDNERYRERARACLRQVCE